MTNNHLIHALLAIVHVANSYVAIDNSHDILQCKQDALYGMCSLLGWDLLNCLTQNTNINLSTGLQCYNINLLCIDMSLRELYAAMAAKMASIVKHSLKSSRRKHANTTSAPTSSLAFIN